MKRLLPLFTFIIVVLTAGAQSQPLFIFEQFMNAKIHFKNRSVTIASMNYDAANDKMFFKDKEQLMELTNYAMIDSISWGGKRCFVTHGAGFMEQVNLENGTAYIHWHIKNVNVGAKGAMGAVTQAKVEQVNIRAMGVFSAEDARIYSADVYQQKNANEYFIRTGNDLKKITTLKHAQKLFPEHKEDIKDFADKQDIKMTEPLSVLELLNYCMGLK